MRLSVHKLYDLGTKQHRSFPTTCFFVCWDPQILQKLLFSLISACFISLTYSPVFKLIFNLMSKLQLSLSFTSGPQHPGCKFLPWNSDQLVLWTQWLYSPGNYTLIPYTCLLGFLVFPEAYSSFSFPSKINPIIWWNEASSSTGLKAW